MLREDGGLFRFVMRVIGGGEFRFFAARQPVVIQTRFPQRHDFWMPPQFAQGIANIFRRAQDVGWMPARDCVNARVFFRQRNRAAAAVQIRADGNHFGNSRSVGARDDLIEIRREIGIIQMRVCIVEDRHDLD